VYDNYKNQYSDKICQILISICLLMSHNIKKLVLVRKTINYLLFTTLKRSDWFDRTFTKIIMFINHIFLYITKMK